MMKMKRFALMAALAVSATLAACGSTPGATVTFGDKDNPARVTGVSGLKSHDVANIVTYGAYTTTVATKSQKEVCSIKAIKGQTISMTGVESITCFAPEVDTVAKPTQAEGEAMQLAKAVREGVGGTIKDATPVLLGGLALNDRNNQRASNERMAAINAESEAAQTGALLEAGAKNPVVLTIPEGGSAAVLSP